MRGVTCARSAPRTACWPCQKAVRERREQRVHPVCARPELLAEAPNPLWSWDITKLKTTVKWTYVYL